MAEKKRELVKRLKEIWDDRDFVCGALSNAGSDQAWQVMLDYLEESDRRGVIVTSDEVLLLSLDLADEFGERHQNPATKLAATMF